MVDSSNDDGVDMDKQRKTFLISFRRPPSSAAAETGDQDQRNDLELLETILKRLRQVRLYDKILDIRFLFGCVGHEMFLVNVGSKTSARYVDGVVKDALGAHHHAVPWNTVHSGEKFIPPLKKNVTHGKPQKTQATIERHAAETFRSGQGKAFLLGVPGAGMDVNGDRSSCPSSDFSVETYSFNERERRHLIRVENEKVEEMPEIDVEGSVDGSVDGAEDGDILVDSSSASDTGDHNETFSAARPPTVTAGAVGAVAAALSSGDMLSATDTSRVAVPPAATAAMEEVAVSNTGMMQTGATTVSTNRNRASFTATMASSRPDAIATTSYSNGSNLTSAATDSTMLPPRPQPTAKTALPSTRSSFFDKSSLSYPSGSPRLTTNFSDASTALPSSGYTTDPSRRGSVSSRDASGFMPLDPTDGDPLDGVGPEGVGGGLDVSALELGPVTASMYGAGGGGSDGGGGGGGASRHAVRRSASLTPAFNSPVLSPVPSPIVMSKLERWMHGLPPSQPPPMVRTGSSSSSTSGSRREIAKNIGKSMFNAFVGATPGHIGGVQIGSKGGPRPGVDRSQSDRALSGSRHRRQMLDQEETRRRFSTSHVPATPRSTSYQGVTREAPPWSGSVPSSSNPSQSGIPRGPPRGMFGGGLASSRPSLTAGRSQSARFSHPSSSNNDNNFAPPPGSLAQSNAGFRSRSTHWTSPLPAKSASSNNGVGMHPRQSAELRNGSMPPPPNQPAGYNNNNNNAGLTTGYGNCAGPLSQSSASYDGGFSRGVLSNDGLGGVFTGNGEDYDVLAGGITLPQQHIPASYDSGMSTGRSLDVAASPEKSSHRKAYSLPSAMNLTSQALSRLKQECTLPDPHQREQTERQQPLEASMESLQLQGRGEDRSRGQEMRTSALPAAANGNGRTGGRGDGRQQAFARGSTAAAASSGGSNSFQHMLEAGGEWLSDEVGKEQRDAGRSRSSSELFHSLSCMSSRDNLVNILLSNDSDESEGGSFCDGHDSFRQLAGTVASCDMDALSKAGSFASTGSRGPGRMRKRDIVKKCVNKVFKVFEDATIRAGDDGRGHSDGRYVNSSSSAGGEAARNSSYSQKRQLSRSSTISDEPPRHTMWHGNSKNSFEEVQDALLDGFHRDLLASPNDPENALMTVLSTMSSVGSAMDWGGSSPPFGLEELENDQVVTGGGGGDAHAAPVSGEGCRRNEGNSAAVNGR